MNDRKADPYKALIAAAKAAKWPTRFQADLTKHDRAVIRALPEGMPFVWVLRESGTHLFTPESRDGVGHTAPDYPALILSAFDDPCLWYWWDGLALIKISGAEQARDLLSKHMCPLCHEGCADIRKHLETVHEFEIEQRRKNPTDAIVSEFFNA